MSPYVKRKDMKEKKPRIEKDVTLAGISVPESAEVNREKRQYKYLDCAFQDADQQYLHITVSPQMGTVIDLSLPEFGLLAKLDALSRDKMHSKVHVVYYEADKVGHDRKGVKRIFTNRRANMNDIKLWKILS